MLDWDDLRVFLAISRHRSLAAAAKELRVTQSTVGRRLASLESGLGARLLNRTADGYVLTLAGKGILANVEQVEREALCLERAVTGLDARLAGVVRVTGSELVTSHLLAPSLAELHAADRSITVELAPLSGGEPVAVHEADVAVQMRPFEHRDIVARKLGALAFGLYASRAYLDRCGAPDIDDGCAGHQLITLLDDRELSAQAAWLREHAFRGDPVLLSDSYETQHRAAASGGGLAVLPRFRGDAEPELTLIGTRVPIPAGDIRLGVHRENRQVPRVRAVIDCVVNAVRTRAAALNPAAAETSSPQPSSS